MNCIICTFAVTEGLALGNGALIHPTCLESLANDFAISNQQVVSARLQVETAKASLKSQEGFFSKIADIISGGRNEKHLATVLRSAQDKLSQSENALADTMRRTTPIFDYLLDYPPDWEIRRTHVQKRDRTCTECGSSNSLQAHHITPLSRGGSNRTENLKLLCKNCHKSAHGGRGFSGENFSDPLPFAQRIQVIESALSNGNDVEFLYKKPNDASKKKRTVTPKRLISMENDHGDGITLCLEGYCHTRKSDRVFALKRMTGLKKL